MVSLTLNSSPKYPKLDETTKTPRLARPKERHKAAGSPVRFPQSSIPTRGRPRHTSTVLKFSTWTVLDRAG